MAAEAVEEAGAEGQGWRREAEAAGGAVTVSSLMRSSIWCTEIARDRPRSRSSEITRDHRRSSQVYARSLRSSLEITRDHSWQVPQGLAPANEGRSGFTH